MDLVPSESRQKSDVSVQSENPQKEAASLGPKESADISTQCDLCPADTRSEARETKDYNKVKQELEMNFITIRDLIRIS